MWPTLRDTDIYTEFKNNQCVIATPQVRQICESAKVPYDESTGLCTITQGYCTSMGADWTYNKNINDYDCNIPLTEEIIEDVFGTTVTRYAKIYYETVAKPVVEAIDTILFPPETSDYENGPIKIKGKCLEVSDGDYPTIHINDCNNSPSQKFLNTGTRIFFEGKLSNNRNATSNYGFEAPCGNFNNGTQLYLNRASDIEEQYITYDENAKTLSFAKNPSKCIDLSGGSTNNYNKIQIWDCNGSDSQKFDITKTKNINFAAMV